MVLLVKLMSTVILLGKTAVKCVCVLGPQVYVILFGEETSPAEGIYSLRAISREDNLPKDTIIAFVDLVDAER